jgi:hypothetical protein
MKPETKKRFIWSPVGGLAIPIAYFLLLILLDKFFHSAFSSSLKWFTLPLLWPAYIYDYVIPVPAEPVVTELPGTGFWVYLMVANFLLYSLLTYLFLKLRQRQPRLR